MPITFDKNLDVRKETQKERTYTLDGLISGGNLHRGGLYGGAYIRGALISGGHLYPGGLISRIISLLANRIAYIGGGGGGG